MKVPFIIYADLESLLEKISNLKSHQQLKQISIQLLVILYLFIAYLMLQKKLNYYKGHDCMK